ncbi:MAG: lipid A biosynthesis lauroyl acyltransferase [Campylobacterota bacterium]|nr:lipid A biosynthesis lauroyl acyltransferase [Campylobacterota bacterium]
MILYYFYRCVEWFLMLLPRSWRKVFFIFLSKVAFFIDTKHRRVILQNLHFALGHDFSPKAEEEISRYCYRNLMLAILQVLENRHQSAEELALHVSFANRHIVDDALKEGRRIIFISAHYGNWELGATALSTLVVPTHATYKKLNNPYFESYLLESRSKLGMNMIEKRGAIRGLTRAIKNAETISFLVDQNVSKKDGIVVNFFGKTIRQTAAPAFLARKYDALIIPLFIATDDEEHYKITFEKPIEVKKSDDAQKDILEATQKQADVVEKIIKENPKFWFWCHRRFKTEHPEIYT